MALTSNNFANAWGLGANDLVGVEIPASPVNADIGTYGIRSIGVPSTTISVNGFGLAYLTAVNGDADRANAEVLCMVQAKQEASPGYLAGPMIRGAGTAGSESGYWCYLNRASGTGVLTVKKIVSGTVTSLATYSLTLPTTETDYFIRFRVNGTTLRARAWKYDAAEPTTWQIDTTDSSVTAAGYVGLAYQALVSNTAGFHLPGFVSVGTAGESAPKPRTDFEIRQWVNDDAASVILLAEIGVLGETATNSGVEVASTVLLSTRPFFTEGSDIPPNQIYDDVIVQAPTMTCKAPESGIGRSTQAFGDLVIKNEDGARDHWLAWNMDGRTVDLYVGAPGWRRWDFVRAMSGTVQEVYVPKLDQIGFKIRDRSALLNRKLQTTQVGGSTANAGAPAPITFGKVFNIEPVLKDAATYRYKFHDESLVGATGITQVRDSGGSVSFTADAANGEFTLSASPTNGSSIKADVTVDLSASSSVKAGNRHGRAIQTIVEDRAGLGAGGAYTGTRTGSLDLFGGDPTDEIGVYAKAEVNCQDLLDQIASSAGGFWYTNKLGQVCASILHIPAGPTYDHSLEWGDVDDFKFERVFRASTIEQLGYTKNWAPQSDGFVGSVLLANRALYAAEAQFTTIVPTYSGLDNPDKHLNPQRPRNRVTFLTQSADAVTEANRLHAINQKGTAIVSFVTKINSIFYTQGESLLFTAPRFGFDLGRPGLILGTEMNFARMSVRLFVFFQIDGRFPVTSAATPFVSVDDFY